jgi:hypothetical protein
VCLVGLWLLQKLLQVVGYGKVVVWKAEDRLVELLWLLEKNISHLHVDPTRHRHKNIFFHL